MHERSAASDGTGEDQRSMHLLLTEALHSFFNGNEKKMQEAIDEEACFCKLVRRILADPSHDSLKKSNLKTGKCVFKSQGLNPKQLYMSLVQAGLSEQMFVEILQKVSDTRPETTSIQNIVRLAHQCYCNQLEILALKQSIGQQPQKDRRKEALQKGVEERRLLLKDLADAKLKMTDKASQCMLLLHPIYQTIHLRNAESPEAYFRVPTAHQKIFKETDLEFYNQNPDYPKPKREIHKPNPHHRKEHRINPIKVYDERQTKALATKKQLQQDKKKKTEETHVIRDVSYKHRIDVIMKNRNNRPFIKHWLCILLMQRLAQTLNSKRKSTRLSLQPSSSSLPRPASSKPST